MIFFLSKTKYQNTLSPPQTADSPLLVLLPLSLYFLLHLFNGVQIWAEQVGAQFFKPSTGNGGVEINALEEWVDLDRRLSGRGKGALRVLTSRPQTADSPLVVGHVLLALPLEFLKEVVNHPVVKVFSSQMGVAGSWLDLENAVLNGMLPPKSKIKTFLSLVGVHGHRVFWRLFFSNFFCRRLTDSLRISYDFFSFL